MMNCTAAMAYRMERRTRRGRPAVAFRCARRLTSDICSIGRRAVRNPAAGAAVAMAPRRLMGRRPGSSSANTRIRVMALMAAESPHRYSYTVVTVLCTRPLA